jgi:hypothetical protein
MSYAPLPISELLLVGVVNAGVPNEERIVLRPTQTVGLGAFGVAVGVADQASGGAQPFYDYIFWFPDTLISPPAWVLLYTGLGTPQQTPFPNGETILTLFWQRRTTIFDDRKTVPILFRPGSAVVGRVL